MDTPITITFLPPSETVDFFARSTRAKTLSRDAASSAGVPETFIDAMAVREAVFVHEQGVPAANELDDDDGRSWHWVAYASVVSTEGPASRIPIGTLRMIPPPHGPHPVAGGVYIAEQLVGILDDPGAPDAPVKAVSVAEEAVKPGRDKETLPAAEDRPTMLHDGVEPYVKLGRLAVLQEHRGGGIAGKLVRAALAWLQENPGALDNVVELKEAAVTTEDKSKGLVCIHAQESAATAWKRWGFVSDEGMGRWFEEGIPHLGMFQRLELQK